MKAKGAARIGILCLMLGCLTTYAVAWKLANTLSGPPRRPSFNDQSSTGWAFDLQRPFGVVLLTAYMVTHSAPSHSDANLPHWSLLRRTTPQELADRTHQRASADWVFECASGWPLVAVVDRECTFVDGKSLLPISGADLSIRWRRGGGNQRVVAFLPLWPGFALDTVLYATLWATTFLGIRRWRRNRRARAGQCPSCCYDLTGITTTICPECGTPTTPAAASSNSP
jgi:hypothetical protein